MKKLYILFILLTSFAYAQEPFITTWQVQGSDLTIKVPIVQNSGNNYSIDFGDGSTLTNQTGFVEHTYSIPGIYTVSISGNFGHFSHFAYLPIDGDELLTIQQWGDNIWTSMEGAFYSCSNLTITATDIPDLSQVTNMFFMFTGCTQMNQSLNDWDVSQVINMRAMFEEASSFNQELNNWDVSNVTDMRSMFFGATSFNQPLSNWDVSEVTMMDFMFYNSAFSQNINNWDVSNVTSMGYMFANIEAFNQPLNSWDVSNVTSMNFMFAYTPFNQPLNDWDVSSVLNMISMFESSQFNQPLDNWDVSNVMAMDEIFQYANSFNQDLSSWNFQSSAISDRMIRGSGLNPANFDALLNKFAQLGFQNKYLYAQGIKYCDYTVIQHLINQLNWTLYVGSLSPNCPNNSLSGTVNVDINSNGCVSNDINLSNFLIETDSGENTITSLIINGNYNLTLLQGTYSIDLLNLPPYYTLTPATPSVTFATINEEQEINFCITANQSVNDLNITLLSLTDARPGFEADYQLVVQNMGTQTEANAALNLSFDNTLQTFVSAMPAASSTTANSLNFIVAELQPFESMTINFTMTTFTPPTVNGGEVINFVATVTPDTNDFTPADNTFNLDQVVVNSFDPNDKRVLQGESIFEAQTDEYLDYIIRFQNTGTASAITVRVEDELHENLDWTTLTPVSSSHDYTVQITDGNRVEFIFNNINLPYEAANAEGSNGFIAYKIKPVEEIAIGEVMSGDASIFFDYNLPIITNEVSTEVVANLSVKEFANSSVSIYPNPVNNVLNLKVSEGILVEKVTIFNLQGRQLLYNTGNTKSINVQNLSSGLYLLVIETNKGVVKHQLVRN